MTEFENRLEMMIMALPRNATVAEIGVFDGVYSDAIIRLCNPRQMYMVDSWEGCHSSGDQDGLNARTLPDMAGVYIDLCRRYRDHGSVRLIRSTSSKFLSSWDENFFDAVYVDSDHSYEGVLADLTGAARVVKQGGIIMGHDFNDPAVASAVRDFCCSFSQKVIGVANDGRTSFMLRLSK